MDLIYKFKCITRTSLYNNAGYLLIGNAVMAFSSFIFWVVAARLYLARDVGYSSAILAAVDLAVVIAIFGVDYSVIRFLPNMQNKTRTINAFIVFLIFSSICVALMILFGIEMFFPTIGFVASHVLYASCFILLVILLSVSAFISSVFISQRRTKFVLYQDVIYSAMKILAVIALSFVFMSFGIVSSVAVAVGIATIIAVVILLPKVIDNYKLFPTVNLSLIKDVWSYSIFSYLVNIVQSAQIMLLPLIVISVLGPEQNAYFYMAWGIYGASFTASGAISVSLFAEGVNVNKTLLRDTKRAIKFSLLFSISLMILLIVAGKWILLAFGQEYSENGIILLRWLAPSIVLTSIIRVYSSILRVKDKMRELIAIWSISAIPSLIASYYLLPIFGITGVGYTWTSIQALLCIYATVKMKILFGKENKDLNLGVENAHN